MATSLGKVGIVDKGNYSSEATYNSGDFVFYEGSTWLALKDALMGIEPVEGENWKYLARGVPDGIATLEQVGVVKPSIDLTIAEDGAIGINTVFESIAERANIESGDTWETVLGKINKYFGDIKPHAFLDKITEDYIDSVITQKVNNAIQNSAIVNNAVTTVEGTVLDGRMGKTLQDQITEQNKNIDGIFLNKSRFKFITTNDIDTIKNDYFPGISNGYVNYFVITNSTQITGYESGDNLRGCQTLTNYDGILKRRYKTNGIWEDWDNFVLNSDLENYSLSRYTVTNQSELNNLLDGITNRYKPNSYYKFCVLINFAGSTLGGGQWLIEGYLDGSTSRGVQKALRYNNGNVEYRMRSLDNLKWGSWISK